MARTYGLRAFGLQMSRRLSQVLWLFCFALFRLYAFVEAAALRSIVLRYADAPTATRVSFSFLGNAAFYEYFVLHHFRFLFVWTIEYVVCSFLPNGVFLPCDHGLDF